jgi:hypothetical protein
MFLIAVLLGGAVMAQVDFIQSFDNKSKRDGESWGFRAYHAASRGPFSAQQGNGSLLLEDERTTFAIAFYRVDGSVLNATAALLYGWRVASLVRLSHQSRSPSDTTVGDGFALSYGPIPSNASYFASLVNTSLERGDASRGVFAVSHETYINGSTGIHITLDGGRLTVDEVSGTLLSQNQSRVCAVVVEARPGATMVTSRGLEREFNGSFDTALLPPLLVRVGMRDTAWYWSARSGTSTTQTELQHVAVSLLADTCGTFNASCPANSIALRAQGRNVCIVFAAALDPESSNQTTTVNFIGADAALSRLSGLSRVVHSSIDNQGRVFVLSVNAPGGAVWSFERLNVCQFAIVTDSDRITLDPGVPCFSQAAARVSSATTGSQTNSARTPDLTRTAAPDAGLLIGAVVGGVVALLCVVGLTIIVVVVGRRRLGQSQPSVVVSQKGQLPAGSHYGIVTSISSNHYADPSVIPTHKPSNYDVLFANEVATAV